MQLVINKDKYTRARGGSAKYIKYFVSNATMKFIYIKKMGPGIC